MSRRICASAGATFVWEKWSIAHEWRDVWENHLNSNPVAISVIGGESPRTADGYTVSEEGVITSLDTVRIYSGVEALGQFIAQYQSESETVPYFCQDWYEGSGYIVTRNATLESYPAGLGKVYMYCEKLVPTYSAVKGTTQYDDVTSRDRNAYPANGEQGGYWYVLKEA